jgi:hypothetical protein
LKQLLILTLITLSILKPSHAYFIETNWKVADYVGSTIFVEPNDVVGKNQYLKGGFAEGVFYSCNFAGQHMTYTNYKREEFLRNPEFEMFKRHKIILEEDIYVHRVSCNGTEDSERRVLYPFVTQTTPHKAFYLFEGTIFMLIADDYPHEMKPWTN